MLWTCNAVCADAIIKANRGFDKKRALVERPLVSLFPTHRSGIGAGVKSDFVHQLGGQVAMLGDHFQRQLVGVQFTP